MGISIICLKLTLNGRYRYWHQALDKILLGLGLNQQVTGIALTCASLLTYGLVPKDMHASFSYQLGCLAFSSYIRDPNILLNPHSHRKALILRRYCAYVHILMTLCLLHGVFLHMKDDLFSSLSTFEVGLQMIPTYFEIRVDWFTDCDCQDKRRHDIVCSKFDNFKSIGQLHWFPSIPAFALSMWYVTSLKWKHASEVCDFNTPEEDKWTYGQILAVLMLMTCLGTAYDAFKGMSSAQ